eukprot:g4548.t1
MGNRESLFSESDISDDDGNFYNTDEIQIDLPEELLHIGKNEKTVEEKRKYRMSLCLEQTHSKKEEQKRLQRATLKAAHQIRLDELDSDENQKDFDSKLAKGLQQEIAYGSLVAALDWLKAPKPFGGGMILHDTASFTNVINAACPNRCSTTASDFLSCVPFGISAMPYMLLTRVAKRHQAGEPLSFLSLETDTHKDDHAILKKSEKPRRVSISAAWSNPIDVRETNEKQGVEVWDLNEDELRSLLLERDRKIAQLESLIESPLHAACINGDKSLVATLINSGMEVDTRDNKYSATPLIAAVISNQKEIVSYLIDASADCDASDKFGRTALHYAVRARNPEIVREILTAGITDVDRKEIFHGYTPLLYAIAELAEELEEKITLDMKNNCSRIVLALLERGADLQVTRKSPAPAASRSTRGHRASPAILHKLPQEASGEDMLRIAFQESGCPISPWFVPFLDPAMRLKIQSKMKKEKSENKREKEIFSSTKRIYKYTTDEDSESKLNIQSSNEDEETPQKGTTSIWSKIYSEIYELQRDPRMKKFMNRPEKVLDSIKLYTLEDRVPAFLSNFSSEDDTFDINELRLVMWGNVGSSECPPPPKELTAMTWNDLFVFWTSLWKKLQKCKKSGHLVAKSGLLQACNEIIEAKNDDLNPLYELQSFVEIEDEVRLEIWSLLMPKKKVKKNTNKTLFPRLECANMIRLLEEKPTEVEKSLWRNSGDDVLALELAREGASALEVEYILKGIESAFTPVPVKKKKRKGKCTKKNTKSNKYKMEIATMGMGKKKANEGSAEDAVKLKMSIELGSQGLLIKNKKRQKREGTETNEMEKNLYHGESLVFHNAIEAVWNCDIDALSETSSSCQARKSNGIVEILSGLWGSWVPKSQDRPAHWKLQNQLKLAIIECARKLHSRRTKILGKNTKKKLHIWANDFLNDDKNNERMDKALQFLIRLTEFVVKRCKTKKLPKKPRDWADRAGELIVPGLKMLKNRLEVLEFVFSFDSRFHSSVKDLFIFKRACNQMIRAQHFQAFLVLLFKASKRLLIKRLIDELMDETEDSIAQQIAWGEGDKHDEDTPENLSLDLPALHIYDSLTLFRTRTPKTGDRPQPRSIVAFVASRLMQAKRDDANHINQVTPDPSLPEIVLLECPSVSAAARPGNQEAVLKHITYLCGKIDLLKREVELPKAAKLKEFYEQCYDWIKGPGGLENEWKDVNEVYRSMCEVYGYDPKRPGHIYRKGTLREDLKKGDVRGANEEASMEDFFCVIRDFMLELSSTVETIRKEINASQKLTRRRRKNMERRRTENKRTNEEGKVKHIRAAETEQGRMLIQKVAKNPMLGGVYSRRVPSVDNSESAMLNSQDSGRNPSYNAISHNSRLPSIDIANSSGNFPSNSPTLTSVNSFMSPRTMSFARSAGLFSAQSFRSSRATTDTSNGLFSAPSFRSSRATTDTSNGLFSAPSFRSSRATTDTSNGLFSAPSFRSSRATTDTSNGLFSAPSFRSSRSCATTDASNGFLSAQNFQSSRSRKTTGTSPHSRSKPNAPVSEGPGSNYKNRINTNTVGKTKTTVQEISLPTMLSPNPSLLEDPPRLQPNVLSIEKNMRTYSSKESINSNVNLLEIPQTIQTNVKEFQSSAAQKEVEEMNSTITEKAIVAEKDELRIDPADGEPKDELRIDPADGEPRTKAMFVDEYGSLSVWDTAEILKRK